MNLYLTDAQVPELALLTKTQRRIVRCGSIRMLEQERPYARLVCALPSGIGGGAGAVVGILLAGAVGSDYSLVLMIICAGVGGGVGGLITGSLLIERLRPYFRRFIAEHPDKLA
jgi:hypothetical protein